MQKYTKYSRIIRNQIQIILVLQHLPLLIRCKITLRGVDKF